MINIIEEIREELRRNGNEKNRLSGERFFKEEIRAYGVKTDVTSKIGKSFFNSVKSSTKTEILALCETLWQSGMLEESFIACNWSYYIYKQYEPADFAVFEKWVNKYVTNWASCDTLCNHSVGSMVETYPELINGLKKWALSDNRWVKRASAVSLIIPARKGLFLKDIFEIADILHSDKDDMVQKGYGWMLKAASQYYQEEVFNYVISRKSTMPRTALRYSIEKMPSELKKLAMSR